MLYDMTTKPEYEANIVASEILLDSNEVLDYIFDYHYSAEEIARCMIRNFTNVTERLRRRKGVQ